MDIRFNYLLPTKIKAIRKLKVFIQELMHAENAAFISLNYIFCSDDYIIQINRDFLKHDYATDIITFNLGKKSSIEGEIYISVETVRANAVEYKTSFNQELLRVIFHGALHLCGYKDKSKKDAALMREMEDKYLGLYQNYLGLK